VLAGEPLAMDAHRALADLAADSGGPAAALRHLRAASRRHPHHLPLHQAIIEWARLKNATAWEQAARHLLHSDPMNAPACRDLAEALQGQGRLAESRAAIAEAAALDPLTTRHDFSQCPMAGDHHPE
jgi:predicted Zn-dependent protease